MVHSHVHPARVWSMLERQEIALKQVWIILLKSFGYEVHANFNEHSLVLLVETDDNDHAALTVSISKDSSSIDSGSSLFNLHLLCNNVKSIYYLLETENYAEVEADVILLYHQELHPVLAKYIPEDLHRALWASGRNDSPDNFILRFLRATDFDVRASLKWLAEVLEWRHNRFGVEEVLFKGDAYLYFEGQLSRLMDAILQNETYIRGFSRSGCPLVHIRTRLHVRGNCPDADYDQFIILLFEWLRLRFLEYKRGTDRAQLLFDLTGFTLKNADFHAVRFLVRAFQKWYPDLVERIYIHNAPRVFGIMWNIVVKWMKPHLRDKILFTRGIDALTKFIDPKHIPKSLGGKDYVPPYVEPTSLNSQRKDADALFVNLMRQRDELTVRFIESTIQWIEASTVAESRVHLDSKIGIAKARGQNYVYLDPYLRTRGVADRNGELGNIVC